MLSLLVNANFSRMSVLITIDKTLVSTLLAVKNIGESE